MSDGMIKTLSTLGGAVMGTVLGLLIYYFITPFFVVVLPFMPFMWGGWGYVRAKNYLATREKLDPS